MGTIVHRSQRFWHIFQASYSSVSHQDGRLMQSTWAPQTICPLGFKRSFQNLIIRLSMTRDIALVLCIVLMPPVLAFSSLPVHSSRATFSCCSLLWAASCASIL